MEKRPKALTVLLRTERKTLVKIELFDAREWGSGAAGYRIRRDGAWVCENGKHTFYTLSALSAYLKRIVAHCLGSADVTLSKEPQIQPGAFVRVRHYDKDLCAGYMVTAKVLGPPIRAIDGRWYVPIRHPGGTTYAEVKS